MGGLYKGVISKLIQSVLTAAILFMVQRRIYEIMKKVRLILDQFFTCQESIGLLGFDTRIG